MTLKEKLNSDKFIVTSEIGPPKGINTAKSLEDAELIRNRVDAINVTDLQSAVMRLGSMVTCYLLKQRGIDSIYQISCRDRNRLALQSDLLSAAVLGIENVLIITGDHPKCGDHPEAMPVFDLDSVHLIEAAKQLQSGKDLSGKELDGTPSFCIGAAVNPTAEPVEPEIIKMEKKAAAGAEFFQTQAVFDAEKFKEFLNLTKHINVPVLAGIVLLKSAAMGRFMNKNIPGVCVPDKFIEQMDKASDKQEKSIEIAARTIDEIKGLCRGVHIMPIGWAKVVLPLLDAARL
ncbi:MAG TPA: 5,10-methylenetetrahydrofolate reductase [Candidatus Omnitrophica bacterium]|nr:5,10-methylenetetrahydrofolate reductase [Candidatus Omnitrophota bacterium]